MTEIDELQRITLRDLKPFFDNCKKFRDKVEKHTEGKSLEERIDFTERSLPKVEEFFRLDYTFSKSFLGGVTKRVVNVEAVIDPVDIDITAFVFRWEYDGQRREERINLEAAPSNLGLNPVRYFVCPYANRRCRKLYTDWRVFLSRWAFPHTYSQRNYSKNWRETYRFLWLMKEVDEAETAYKYRKEYYRGRVTPFGVKMRNKCKFMKGCVDRLQTEKGQRALLIPRGKGRPSKRW